MKSDYPIPEASFLAALHGRLPQELPQFLRHRRWFGSKARGIRAVEILDLVPVHGQTRCWYLALVVIRYDSGANDTYNLPLARTVDGPSMLEPASLLKLTHESFPEGIVLADALSDGQFLTCLLDSIAKGVSFRGVRGEVRATPTSALAALWKPSQEMLNPSLMKAEQSNSSVVYGERLVLKLFRRTEEGINPDLEIGSFLTEESTFRNVPPMAGYLEYLSDQGTRTALGILQGYVANQGDAWQFTLRALAEYYEMARQGGTLAASDLPRDSILALTDHAVPEAVRRRVGPYVESAARLGRRTAELHLALASARQNPALTPQPLSEVEQEEFVASALNLVTANFGLLRRLRDEMPAHLRREAGEVLNLEDKMRQRLQLLQGRISSVMLTRIHGDYHLGQVLFTGNDFVIIDFEGEPARSLQSRRRKRSPLQDVAGMLRSFHYAAYTPLQGTAQPSDAALPSLRLWAFYWQKWVSAIFLNAYLETSRGAQFIPRSREDLALFLDTYLLDKAVYELGYELNNRPTWVRIPLEGISQLLSDTGQALK